MSVPHRRRSRLAGQFAWVAGGRAVAAVLQAVTLVLLARSLGPADFGHVAAFLGLVTIVQVTADLGLSTLVTRERAAAPESPAVRSALRLTLVTAAVICGVVAAGLGLAGAVVDPLYIALLPMALWAAAERNADVWLSVAFADGDAKVNVINVVGRRAVVIVLFVALDFAGSAPVVAFAAASASSAVAANAAARWSVRGRVKAGPTVPLLEVFRLARPYWANSVATQARNVDAALVGAIGGAQQSGLYASGSRLTTPLRILPTSLASVLIPHAARNSTSRAQVVRNLRIAAVASAGTAVFYLCVAAVTPFVVVPVLGEAYRDAIVVIVVVLVGLPMAGAASLVGGVLQGVGQARAVAIASTTSTIGCLIAIGVLTPPFGAVGAAAALSVSYALQLSTLLGATRGMLRSFEQ